jgi:hypothetical protein
VREWPSSTAASSSSGRSRTCGRLDLTVEALVIQPAWSDIFTELDRTASRQRLEAYGFDVDGCLERLRLRQP